MFEFFFIFSVVVRIGRDLKPARIEHRPAKCRSSCDIASFMILLPFPLDSRDRVPQRGKTQVGTLSVVIHLVIFTLISVDSDGILMLMSALSATQN